ncbi:MAG: hypothetical protein AAFR87_23160 [Bacteroidota bacterium]
MRNITKLLISSLLLALFAVNQAYAQSPEAFKYQAVLRDANYAPITGQNVSIRISILESTPDGTIVYQEAHSNQTSAIGLVVLNIGEGNVLSGIFADIQWGSSDHFLQVEVDQAGGTNYSILGTSQLLSVPYALYAKEAGKVELIGGEGIQVEENVINNLKPSLWELDSNIVFVDTSFVAIGITDTTFNDSTSLFPTDAPLYVNGNIRLAEDSALLGLGEIVGSSGISFSANPDREGDMVIASNGRVTFEEEVGINQSFSFVDLNVRNQLGNSTVFQVEDTAGQDIFEVGRGRNVGINRITNNVTLQVRSKDALNTPSSIIANFEKINGDNVFQVQNDNDVVVTGDFSVNSGNKNFILDHPLDPANMILAHNAVESPDHVTYYHGTIKLDANGQAVVELPDYFEALNTDFHYQLTCVGGFAQVYIAEEIKDNQFRIAGGKDGMKVSWQVSARRDDPWAHDHPYQAEIEKEAGEKGLYYYPEGYGKGRAFKIGSQESKEEK